MNLILGVIKLKRKLVILLLVLAMINLNLLPVFAAEIEDLSEDHWAYESVVELVERGYMSLQDDNRFEGEEKVTRYQLAEIIAEILNNIEQGFMTAEEDDILTLQNLATEFRSELVDVIRETEELEENVEEYVNQYEIFAEDLSNSHGKINDVQQEVNDLMNDLREEAARIESLESQVADLEEENESLENRMEELEREIRRTGTQSEIDRLNRRFFWLSSGGAIAALLLLLN